VDRSFAQLAGCLERLSRHDAWAGLIAAAALIFGTAIPYAAPNQRRRKFLGMTDAFMKTDVVAPIAQFLAGRDPRTAAGHRRTRRLGRTSSPVRFDEAAD